MCRWRRRRRRPRRPRRVRQRHCRRLLRPAPPRLWPRRPVDWRPAQRVRAARGPARALSKSGRYVPVAGDQYPVPLASLRSVANDPPSVAPANFQVSQSCGRQTAAVRAAFAGSCSASHRSLVTVNEATGTDPTASAQACGPPSSATRSSAARADRVSFHSRAGRITFPSSSRQIIPCCCPPTAIAATSSRPPAARAASCSAIHQTCGSTSVPGGCDDRPSRINAPDSASRMMTLHVWVDESIPATRVMRPPARSVHAGWVDHWASGFEYPASSCTCASIQPCARRYMAAVRVHVWVNQG